MMRSALLLSLRNASRPTACRAQLHTRRVIAPCLSAQYSRKAYSPSLKGVRYYSAPAGLSRSEVEGRIMDLLKNFDKVKDATKLSPNSNFGNDLGLDSLDTVEVVMAIEEEFSIEIPDKEADGILSIDKAVDYIMGQPDAH